jgi:carboxymethylenebutenolidase
MDAVGPRPALKAMAERLALNGYVVLLPNLFYREKYAPIVSGVDFPVRMEDVPEVLKQIMPLVERFNTSEALQDMGVYLNYLAKQPYVRQGKSGIFGYCMGGAMAIRTAAEYPESFAAVASFHAGGLVTEETDSPHRLLPRIHASLYVGHADQDPHMAHEQIKIFDKAVTALSIPREVELYSGAHHHFAMSDLPAYDARAAEKHWVKLTQLFQNTL